MTDPSQWRAEERQRQAACRERCEADNEIVDYPQGLKDMLWRMAWESGHSAGFQKVEMHYSDYADIAKEARK